jgi:hypothetical protein
MEDTTTYIHNNMMLESSFFKELEFFSKDASKVSSYLVSNQNCGCLRTSPSIAKATTTSLKNYNTHP